MPKKPVPPSERHRAEQVPPHGPAEHPDPGASRDPAPDDLGQEGEQSTVKPNTTGQGRRQDRI